MTQFHSPKPPDFDPLRAFVQANAPQAPEPPPEFEAQLMQAIESLPQEFSNPGEGVTISRGISKRWWILGAAIVTGMGLIWGGRSWQLAQRSFPVPGSEAELLALQDFLEDTWGVVGYVDTTETWSNTPWIALGRTNSL